MQPEVLIVDHIKTPVGRMRIVADANAVLHGLDWEHLDFAGDDVELRNGNSPRSIRDSIDAYFAGTLDALLDITVRLRGTSFQHQVWEELRRIPVGATVSYSALAATIGRPRAMRAVGLANNRNRISIVIPCHRVIGADKSLTGYAGGLLMKQWLLTHEGALLA